MDLKFLEYLCKNYQQENIMATVIIDTRNKEAKRLVEYLKTVKYAKVIENNEELVEYDSEFVKMIYKRDNDPNIKLDISSLWK